MGIIDKVKAVLGNSRGPGESDEKLLCALVFKSFTGSDGQSLVQSVVVGPTPGARTFEDVNILVLTAMVCALDEFERRKNALVAIQPSEQELRQILLVDSYGEGPNPVSRAVDRLVASRQGAADSREVA